VLPFPIVDEEFFKGKQQEGAESALLTVRILDRFRLYQVDEKRLG